MNDQRNISDIEDDNLKKDAPNLYGIEKQKSFSTPDGYFDEFSSKVISRIADEKTSNRPAWRIILQPRVAIAASVVVVGLAIAAKFVFFNSVEMEETATTEEFFADLSDAELESLSNELFMEDVVTEIVDEGTVPFEHIEDEEAIIEYLLENDIDIHTLSNEL